MTKEIRTSQKMGGPKQSKQDREELRLLLMNQKLFRLKLEIKEISLHLKFKEILKED